MFTFGQSYPVSYLFADEYQPFGTGQQEGLIVQPSVKVKSLVIGYQFPKLGYIAFAICDRLIQALYLDQLGTSAIQPVLFALLPLLIATPPAIQAVNLSVAVSPVLGFGEAGNPIHPARVIRLMSVVSASIGKVGDYRVE